MECGPAISPIIGSQKRDRESKNGGPRGMPRNEGQSVCPRSHPRGSPPMREAGRRVNLCQARCPKLMPRNEGQGPDPRGLHATAGLLRTIEGELAIVKELKDTLANRLERIDTSLEILNARV